MALDVVCLFVADGVFQGACQGQQAALSVDVCPGSCCHCWLYRRTQEDAHRENYNAGWWWHQHVLVFNSEKGEYCKCMECLNLRLLVTKCVFLNLSYFIGIKEAKLCTCICVTIRWTFPTQRWMFYMWDPRRPPARSPTLWRSWTQTSDANWRKSAAELQISGKGISLMFK